MKFKELKKEMILGFDFNEKTIIYIVDINNNVCRILFFNTGKIKSISEFSISNEEWNDKDYVYIRHNIILNKKDLIQRIF